VRLQRGCELVACRVYCRSQIFDTTDQALDPLLLLA
jgi:hypothetical protein